MADITKAPIAAIPAADQPVQPDDSGLPPFSIDLRPRIISLPDIKQKTEINVRYPLLPPYATAHIFWDDTKKELVYEVEEVQLTETEKELLKLLQLGLEEMINISFVYASKSNLILKYLEKNVQSILLELGAKISKKSYLKIMYFLYRDFIGLNEIEPIMNDHFIEDIECNGAESPIYIVHRKYQNMRTNVIFADPKRLIDFVEKLAQKTGRYVSFAKPLLDGTLPDGSLDYNEPVIFREYGKIKVAKIGAFVDRFYTTDSKDPVPVNGIEVPCFDKDMKIQWKPAQYVYRHALKEDEKLYKLALETGREITLTGAHSIFSLKQEGVVPTRTEDIKQDDFVSIPLKLPPNEEIKEINLAERLSKTKYAKKLVMREVPENIFIRRRDEIREFMKAEYKLFRQAFYEHRKKRILPLKLYNLLTKQELRVTKIASTSSPGLPSFLKPNSKLMRLLGYYIAEGWLSSNSNTYMMSFSLNKKETDIIEEIREAAKSLNLKIRVEKEGKNAVKVHINSFVFWIMMTEALELSKGAHNKRVPEIVFNSPPELQKEFLRAWWKGDEGYSVSKGLLSDVLYISLFLNNVASMQFRVKSAVFKEKKGNRLVKSAVYYTQRLLTKKLKYPYSIPIQIFNPLKETHYRFSNERISRERMKSILNELRYQRFLKLKGVPEKFLKEWEKRSFVKQGVLTDKGRKLIEEINTIRKLIDSDIGFVKVKKIEKTDSSSKYVYDFSVKDNENFIGGTGGILCHNSRVNATYTSDITTHGPTFTIRKFTKEPLTAIHLIGYETGTPEVFAFFWLAVEHKFNVMVIGETASGKTTFLNAILQFVPTEARIVSIEDTRELSLAHENWVPSVSRSGFGIPNILGQQYGEVTLFDLLKETFRQNPDYVVVGEVRGKETYVLFQGMASIPGDQKVMVLKDGKPQLVEIGLIHDIEGLQAICYDPIKCEAKILPIAGHIRHPARKDLVKITTKTGREIVTTPDHSLFTLMQGEMIEVPASMLKQGNKIAIAGRIPCGYADIKKLSLLDLVPNIRIYSPELVKEASQKLGYLPASKICQIASISDYYSNFSRASPASMKKEQFTELMKEANIKVDYDNVKVKLLRKSRPVDPSVEVSDEFLRLLGYYLSEGTINFSGKNSSVALYNKNLEILSDMEHCLEKITGKKPSKRITEGFGTCTELKIGNRIFAELMNSLCGRTSGKHIPEFIYGLSKERIGQFMTGLFTGDGYTTSNSFGYTTCSKELGQQIQQLLLVYGIVASLYTGKTKQGNKIFELKFFREADKEEFLKYAKVIGRKPFERKEKSIFTRKINDVYLDKIKKTEIIRLETAVPVYDLAVPGPENFLSSTGVILHNSGHPSFSTFHAASVETVLRRLETPPINLPASLVNSLNIICSVVHIKEQRRNIRRVKDIKEIIEVKQQLGEAETHTLFDWNPITDKIIYHGNSYLMQQISKKTGIPISDLERELKIRAELLTKMQEQSILNHEEVTLLINQYYKDPAGVMAKFGIKGETAMKPEEVKETMEKRSMQKNKTGKKSSKK